MAYRHPNPFKVGQRVELRGYPGDAGIVEAISENGFAVTVHWDDGRQTLVCYLDLEA